MVKVDDDWIWISDSMAQIAGGSRDASNVAEFIKGSN